MLACQRKICDNATTSEIDSSYRSKDALAGAMLARRSRMLTSGCDGQGLAAGAGSD